MIEKPIISVHFPKSAGSSLAEAYRRHCGENVHFDYSTDPADPLHQHNIAPSLYPDHAQQIPERVRVVHGHFHPNKYRHVEGAYRLTFLREPVSNLISIYFFWRLHESETTNALFQTFKNLSPTIMDFAEFPIFKRLMSQTYFGDVDMKSFDFIGFHEHREEDLSRLSAEIGVPFEAELYLNRTADQESEARNAILGDPEIMSRLRASLSDDCRFYEQLRARRH